MSKDVIDVWCDIPGSMTCSEWNRSIRPVRRGFMSRLFGMVRRERA